MNDKDVYEQWKEERSSIKAPSNFRANVMAEIANRRTSQVERKPSMLERPLWATFAIVAASIFGLARVAFALLIGIS